jgi:hypothetical protein
MAMHQTKYYQDQKLTQDEHPSSAGVNYVQHVFYHSLLQNSSENWKI